MERADGLAVEAELAVVVVLDQDLLNAWEEAPFSTDRERAALALTESATWVHTAHIPDDVHDRARQHFTDEELARLLFAIATINAWNRLAVGSRIPVGGYQPAKPAAATG